MRHTPDGMSFSFADLKDYDELNSEYAGIIACIQQELRGSGMNTKQADDLVKLIVHSGRSYAVSMVDMVADGRIVRSELPRIPKRSEGGKAFDYYSKFEPED